MVVGFCWNLMLLWTLGAQFKGSERFLGLFHDFEDGYIKVLRFPILISVEFKFETYGEPILDSRFMQFVFRISGVIKL